MKFSLSDVVQQPIELPPHSHICVLLLTENDRPARRSARWKVHRKTIAIKLDVKLHCLGVTVVGGGATGVGHLIIFDVRLFLVFLLSFRRLITLSPLYIMPL